MNELNEYGIPMHACHGYRHDNHYWTWRQNQIDTEPGPYYDWLRDIRDGRI